jgi:branched-chain amino acid transport system permease protein
VAVAGLAALAVGVFVVRVKSIYFIMATLAFAQMFFFLFHDTEFGRGSDGITMNFRPVAALGAGADFAQEIINLIVRGANFRLGIDHVWT